MDYFIICLVALIGSALTLFSGFGLGTILLPVFGLFFPIEMAIALTAIVHFLNNLFKLGLVGKHADKAVVLQFGIPSIIAAFLGAYLLTRILELPPIFTYSLGSKVLNIMPMKLIIGLLLIFFALFDILPRFKNLQFSRKYLPLGGFLSGFFGGLSGHQGALRSAFLIRANLTKEAFIATGVVIACMIDISRLSIYSKQIFQSKDEFNYTLIAAATLSAFLGAYLGNKLLKKVTIDLIQYIVAAMIFVFAVLLIMGIA
jgi:uncharacterized protein